MKNVSRYIKKQLSSTVFEKPPRHKLAFWLDIYLSFHTSPKLHPAIVYSSLLSKHTMPPYTSINADSKNKAMANSSTSPLRSSLHITSHFLVVQSSLVISEVLKKYILKCRSIAPQQVCYILVMKSERDCVGQNQDFVETIDVVEGVISVLDFLQALSNNDFRPEDLNSLPLSSFSHTSYLEFEWLHHEKDPQGFDLLVNISHPLSIDFPKKASQIHIYIIIISIIIGPV